jgi:hypothetical protein
MSQQERWQLGGNTPEIYEHYLVPAILGLGRLCSLHGRHFIPANGCST